MRKAVVLLGALALGMVTSVGAAANQGIIAARGGESFVPNALIIPTDVEEVFGCQAPGEPCGDALAAHVGGGPLIDVGSPGLDAPGDSLLFFAGESASATISAPAGSTLFYLCAIHPWMQGSIIVR
jgi:hypothetical protein